MNYTIKEASEALGVSTDTIRRRIKEGKIKAHKVEGRNGPQWAIPEDELTGSDGQQVIEVIPVKREISPEDLKQYIGQAIAEGIEGHTEAYKARTEVLIQEVLELRKAVKTLTEALEAPEKAQEEETTARRERWWKFWVKEK